jgi:hypothetical protein
MPGRMPCEITNHPWGCHDIPAGMTFSEISWEKRARLRQHLGISRPFHLRGPIMRIRMRTV